MGSPPTTSTPSGLADALFSSVEQRLLALLFGQPDRRYQSSELVRLARTGNGATQRVLARLTAAGLVTVTEVGNQKHYQANRSSPIFEELHGLVVKTVGLVEPLRAALDPLASRMRAAFVYGSIAKGTDRARSDVDLMVVSDELGHADLFTALAPVESVLARAVNPTVFGSDEWRLKRAKEDSFASRVARGPRLFVVGSANDVP
ncbi:MAG TPA: nucleotidyltransferase domain-containing protein [Thermoanaerobaculia bacterium]|nr:nucleotidyltransferase domain-containing protein [Thermoanaerobaculia bacterium]